LAESKAARLAVLTVARRADYWADLTVAARAAQKVVPWAVASVENWAASTAELMVVARDAHWETKSVVWLVVDLAVPWDVIVVVD